MKALIIIVIAAVVVAVRLGLRRRGQGRGQGRSSPTGGVKARFRGRGVMGDTGLVAGREIRERLRGRVFRVVTVILFVAVAAAVVIPTLHNRNNNQSLKVGVVAGPASLHDDLHNLAKRVGVSVEVVDEPDLSQARAALEAGTLDMVMDGATRVLVENPISTSDSSDLANYAQVVSVSLGAQQAFAHAGLTPHQAATIAGARPLPVESLHPAKPTRTTAEATALLGVILTFIILTQYLTWTLMGVMEEKASRVVEVLLATVRPIQLLAGKLLGIAAVAMTQAVALVVFALVLGAAVGSTLVHGAAPLVVVASLVWLVLGYAFYSWVYAAAGSLAERQDQVQSMALPLSAPLILGYIVSLTGVTSGHPSTLLKVLAYLPPTAPFAMPTLVGFGETTWWLFLLSVVVSLGCTVLVAMLAARVYGTAVLQTGGRVRLRELVPTLRQEREPRPYVEGGPA